MRFNDISVISNRRHISLLTEDILYIQLSGRQSIIHFSDGRTYETYATIHELKVCLAAALSAPTAPRWYLSRESTTLERRLNSSTEKHCIIAVERNESSKNSCAPDGGRLRRAYLTATRPPHRKNISGTMPAMTARPLRLPTSRWCSTRSVPLWTGSSATVTRHWLKSKNAAAAAHQPLFRQHFPQYGRKVAARLRAHSAVR